eukprot:scaffold2778_cov76-Skeletonema_dohrnii-CCMP3373.AAC.1
MHYEHAPRVVEVDGMAWSAIQALRDQDPILLPAAIFVPHEGLFYPYLVEEAVQRVMLVFRVSISVAVN